jgi:hypothetical protein
MLKFRNIYNLYQFCIKFQNRTRFSRFYHYTPRQCSTLNVRQMLRENNYNGQHYDYEKRAGFLLGIIGVSTILCDSRTDAKEKRFFRAAQYGILDELKR